MIQSDNQPLQLANHFIHYTGMNLFLTGKAGTGKTTFLRNLKKESPKRMVVLAPTGVAAINAGGATIHSFFQLPFSPYIPDGSGINSPRQDHKFSKEKINIIRSLDLLVIDEISMVRADLMDAIDDVLRHYRRNARPFGGIQLLLIGDVQQLSPVIRDEEWHMLKPYYDSPYFFNSKALLEARYVTVQLEKVYRQADPTFVNILNAIRENNMTPGILQALNKRYIPDFLPTEKDDYITLTTHNNQANAINEKRLQALKTSSFHYTASIEGSFPEYAFPTEQKLHLKKGAQVMFVKNDPSPDKKYYNGKIGKIAAISQSAIQVVCDDVTIQVEPQEWTNTKYHLNEKTKEIVETIEGKFTQIPLKTAWAITIHKSQGLTFDRAIVNASSAFTHGQVYVALSRCRTLEGLVLSQPIQSNLIKQDYHVKAFNEYIASHKPTENELDFAKENYFMEIISELTGFKSIKFRCIHLHRMYQESLSKLYPKKIQQLDDMIQHIETELIAVSERFKRQLAPMIHEWKNPEENDIIQERIAKASAYYLLKMDELIKPFLLEGIPAIDNKETAKHFEQEYELLTQAINVKYSTFESAKTSFKIKDYLSVKAKTLITPVKTRKETVKKDSVMADIKYPVFYTQLCKWRKNQADELNLPAYTIMQQKALVGIVNKLPTNKAELLAIPGVGKKVVERFGPAIIEMIDDFRVDMGELLDL